MKLRNRSIPSPTVLSREAGPKNMAHSPMLPHEVLTGIMKLCDVEHRLSRCALVHSTWAAAARAATDSIQVQLRSEFHLIDLFEWLTQHGEHSRSLGLDAQGLQIGYIPPACSHLRDLRLNQGQLRLDPSCHVNNLLAGATALTRLELQACSLHSRGDSLSALSVLTGLQHLVVERVVQPGSISCVLVPGSLFSQLLQLTHLQLDGGSNGLTETTFQHLGCLTRLQHLQLKQLITQPHSLTADAAGGLTGLSGLTQLTGLLLEGLTPTLTAQSTPQLAPLTNLQKLTLSQIPALDPAILADTTQLQCLTLVCTKVVGEAVGVAALLEALRGMQQLTSLWLQDVLAHCMDATPPEWLTGNHDAEARHAAAAAAAAELYAALTCSPHLQTLFLKKAVVPPAAWQHMFAPNKHLPCLTDITISVDERAVERGATAYMTSADLAGLVRCCCNLERLSLGWAVGFISGFSALQAGVSLAPLLDLTRLTELQVHGVKQ